MSELEAAFSERLLLLKRSAEALSLESSNVDEFWSGFAKLSDPIFRDAAAISDEAVSFVASEIDSIIDGLISSGQERARS